MSNEKGTVLPRRQRAEVPVTSENKELLQKQLIDSAPLQTSPAKQTNPEHEDPVEQVKELSYKEKFPWRENTDMSAADLMSVRKKKSVDIPAELDLRLEYIKGKRKPKGFGERITVTSIMIEYLDKCTRAELKKLGFEVD